MGKCCIYAHENGCAHIYYLKVPLRGALLNSHQLVCLIFVEKSLSSHLPSVAILQLPPVLPSVSQHIL